MEIGLSAFLRQHRRIAVDTNIFVYQLENKPQYASLTDAIFSWIANRGVIAVTSTVTMAELLVPAYRDADEERANEYYSLLSTFPHLEWVAPNLRIADLAAQLRASHGLRTPDALQAATALYAEASGFITNDPIFERVRQLDVLVLDNLLQV